MPEHGHGRLFYVFGEGMIPSGEHGTGARGTAQGNGRPWAGAKLDVPFYVPELPGSILARKSGPRRPDYGQRVRRQSVTETDRGYSLDRKSVV